MTQFTACHFQKRSCDEGIVELKEECEVSQEEEQESKQQQMEALMRMFRHFGIAKKETPKQLLKTVDREGIVDYIKSGKCKNIVTMVGAGISTSAGIPDFRSPDSGLYANLQKYNLPSPEAIFQIEFFKKNPEPFFHLAKNLWPGCFKPTPCHYFLCLLEQKGFLKKHFTQNIDTLERVAGLNPDKIVEAHGTFHTSHCISCRCLYSQEWIKEKVFADEIPTCGKDGCGGFVKPDIVFFGENLPQSFHSSVEEDLPQCDLLIILGTSLVVQPFASLVNRVPNSTPRLYINLENNVQSNDPFMALMHQGTDFNADGEDNYRDVFWKSSCDEACYKFADELGWKEEFQDLISSGLSKIQEENIPAAPSSAEGKAVASGGN